MQLFCICNQSLEPISITLLHSYMIMAVYRIQEFLFYLNIQYKVSPTPKMVQLQTLKFSLTLLISKDFTDFKWFVWFHEILQISWDFISKNWTILYINKNNYLANYLYFHLCIHTTLKKIQPLFIYSYMWHLMILLLQVPLCNKHICVKFAKTVMVTCLHKE